MINPYWAIGVGFGLLAVLVLVGLWDAYSVPPARPRRAAHHR